MRTPWVICGLSVLASMGVCLIVVGQLQSITRLADQAEDLKLKAESLDLALDDKRYQMRELESMLEELNNLLPKLEGAYNASLQDYQRAANKSSACMEALEPKVTELAVLEEEHNNTDAGFTKERQIWAQEITVLKTLKAERSKVCNFAKKELPEAQKLCEDT